MTIGPMVPLTTAATPFAARVLAAHLGAEGIVWELRGNVDGPYPLGPVQVLVAEDDLAVAREIVTEHPPVDVLPDDRTDAGSSLPVPASRASSPRRLWLALALVVLAAAVLLGRLLALTWQ